MVRKAAKPKKEAIRGISTGLKYRQCHRQKIVHGKILKRLSIFNIVWSLRCLFATSGAGGMVVRGLHSGKATRVH